MSMDKWMTEEQRNASLLPQVTEQDGETVEVTVCGSMSGGADEIHGMPHKLSLIRWRDGKERRADYVLTGYPKTEAPQSRKG